MEVPIKAYKSSEDSGKERRDLKLAHIHVMLTYVLNFVFISILY